MNSVMDDNRLLTLTNGERIKLVDECRLIFEVGDLQYASPATVSRCGMVFVDPTLLGFKPYWDSWLYNRPSFDQKNILRYLYTKYVDPLMSYIFKSIRNGRMGEKPVTIVKTDGMNILDQLCYLLSSLLNVNEENDKVIEAIFIQSICWSFGATITREDRPKFDYYVKYLTMLPVMNNSDEIPPGEKPIVEVFLYTGLFYLSRLYSKC